MSSSTDIRATVRITSYFSLDTDLAAEMGSWPEFVSGEGYDVQLRSQDGSEDVSVKYVPETNEDHAHVLVTASSDGPLFERTLGRASYALAAHSDNLMVRRWRS